MGTVISYTQAALDDFLSGKSNVGHDHDELYYTKDEVDTEIAANLPGAPADATISSAVASTTSATRASLRDFVAASNPSQMGLDAMKFDSIVRGTGLLGFVRRMLNNVYEIGYQIDDRRVIAHTLAIYGSAPGGATYQTLNQLQAVEARRCMTPRDETAAGVTLTGAGWATSTSTRAYGGTYRRNTTAGQTAAFTTALGATKIGLIAGTLNNGGYSKVSIVDNAAAPVTANLLPTAQDEVTAGRLAATALIANGGTLDPTDRVLNQYSTLTTYYDGYVGLADALDPLKTYTVTLTVTGYKQAASSDVRLYFSGWAADDITTATLSSSTGALDPSIYIVEEQLGVTGTSFSAFEWALFVNPVAGAPADKWETVGSVHGYEKQISLTVTVDGAVKTMGTAEWFLARSVSIDRVTEIWHPHFATKIADTKMTYRSAGSDGLRMGHKITWATAVKCSFAYTLMWPYTALWTRGTFAGYNLDGTVNLADGSRFSAARSNAMIAWGSASSYAGFCTWDQNLVSGYSKAPNSRNQIEDRTGGTIKKLYVARTYNGDGDPIIDVASGEVWTGSRLYRISRLPGAEQMLARPA